MMPGATAVESTPFSGDASAGSKPATPQQRPPRVWSLPWIVLFLALYAFTLPWIYFAIIEHYFIRHDWNGALPGLGTTLPRRVCMGSHMACGAMSLLLGPTQFVPRIRRRAPAVHRWCGRAYILFATSSSIFGLAFICLKGGRLSGGPNMTAAFASAGVAFGYCAVVAYVKARDRKWEDHRAWTVRSFSQVLSPMLYRYWYFAPAIFGLDVSLNFDPATDCDPETGVCPVFLRPFDMVHAWTYWITSLLVAEWIIRLLPPMGRVEDGIGVDNDEEQPLKKVLGSDGYRAVDIPKPGREVSASATSAEMRSAVRLNATGVALAVITSVLTAKFYTHMP